jgi:hypothetical protein
VRTDPVVGHRHTEAVPHDFWSTGKPTCQTTGIPILHGMPSSEVLPAVDQGLLALGGCEPGDEDSSWWCPQCEKAFVGPGTGGAVNEAIEKGTGLA